MGEWSVLSASLPCPRTVVYKFSHQLAQNQKLVHSLPQNTGGVTTGRTLTGHGSRVTGHELRIAARCCRPRRARPMIEWRSDTGGDTVSTEAVAPRRHAGTHLAATWWKLELPTTTWHLLLN